MKLTKNLACIDLHLQPVKIVHLTSAHPPFDTRIFLKECTSLAEAGYKVTLLVPHAKDEIVNSVNVCAISRATNRLNRMTVGVFNIYQRLKKIDASIYHFHDPELIPLGLMLRIQGKRVIYDIHEDLPRSLYASSRDYLPVWLKKPTSWLLECIENLSTRLFTGLVAATPTIAQRFIKKNNRTITLNNYPLLNELTDANNISWNKRSSAVVYIGSISLERGLFQMVESMSLISKELNVRLRLAGNFNLPKNCSEIYFSQGWEKTDKMGFLNRRQVSALLSDVRAGLVLFHPDPNHIHSQPNKLFEYLSAGLPVVVSNFPAWHNFVSKYKCGIAVDPLKPKEIAAAIAYLFNNPLEAEEMGKRGKKAVVENYNWDIEKKKLMQIYKEILNDE